MQQSFLNVAVIHRWLLRTNWFLVAQICVIYSRALVNGTRTIYTETEKSRHLWAFYLIKWLFSRGRVPIVKVVSLHSTISIQIDLIRSLKWGTLCLWAPTGSKMAGRQSLTIKKHVRFSTETDVFFNRSNSTAYHFGTSWKFRDIMHLILKV